MSIQATIKTAATGAALAALLLIGTDGQSANAPSSPVVDTGQQRCFGNGPEITSPEAGQAFFGQDAQYQGNTPSYEELGDGTVKDLVTGLIWQKTPDFVKRTQDDAEAYADQLNLAGQDDWRLPTIKELFSLADFRGNMRTRTPYIDTAVFDFEYPESDQGESGRPGRRNMDAQYCSSTRYVGITMGRDESAFGFNFADGRIKSYPLRAARYVRCVRGKTGYGENRFRDNGDGTVSDAATGLVWQTADSGETLDWEQALAYAEGLELAGRDDWRLPSVKELQMIIDYGLAPDARDADKRAPALDDLFELTTSESWFWSNTTHIENAGAYYVCFGQSFSAWRQAGKQINAHGAGAVRSDPKEGDPGDWPDGKGPQGDEIRIYNYVRCVRGGAATLQAAGPPPAAMEQRRPRRGDRQGQGVDDEAVSGLKVVTVGTGSPLYNAERDRASVMVEYGGKRFLVDMGEGTAARLSENNIALKSFEAICFTHHHQDHNADAMSILPQAWVRGSSAPVIGPVGTGGLVDFLWSFYEEDMAYRTRRRGGSSQLPEKPAVFELPLAERLSIAGVTISTIDVPHSIATFAYRFDAAGESVVISGDLSYSENLVKLAKGADILVMDSGAIVYRSSNSRRPQGRRRGQGKSGARNEARPRSGKRASAHASLEDVARMAAEAGVDKLVLTHFRPGEVDEEETRRRIGEIFGGKVHFAEDMRAYLP